MATDSSTHVLTKESLDVGYPFHFKKAAVSAALRKRPVCVVLNYSWNSSHRNKVSKELIVITRKINEEQVADTFHAGATPSALAKELFAKSLSMTYMSNANEALRCMHDLSVIIKPVSNDPEHTLSMADEYIQMLSSLADDVLFETLTPLERGEPNNGIPKTHLLDSPRNANFARRINSCGILVNGIDISAVKATSATAVPVAPAVAAAAPVAYSIFDADQRGAHHQIADDNLLTRSSFARSPPELRTVINIIEASNDAGTTVVERRLKADTGKNKSLLTGTWLWLTKIFLNSKSELSGAAQFTNYTGAAQW